jgi:hypothetical protein
MNSPESLCQKIVRLARANLPPLKEGAWSCEVAEKLPPVPAETPGAERWGVMWPGDHAERFPGPIPEDSPLLYTCLLRSPESEQKVYLVPFLQEAGRLLLIGKPIPVRTKMSWAEEGPPMPGRPSVRYSTQEQAVVLFLQGPSAFWVVLGLQHPPWGTGDGGSYVYEIYRVDHTRKKWGLFRAAQKEARAVAEFRSSYGFEVDRHHKVYYSFYRGREGEMEIDKGIENFIEGDPDACYSETTHFVWDGKQFVPLDKKIFKGEPSPLTLPKLDQTGGGQP